MNILDIRLSGFSGSVFVLFSVVGCQGEKGDQGIQGITGPTGVDELVEGICADDTIPVLATNPISNVVTLTCMASKEGE